MLAVVRAVAQLLSVRPHCAYFYTKSSRCGVYLFKMKHPSMKSSVILCGTLCVLLALLSVGCGQSTEGIKSGRFQLVGTTDGNIFKIDTATGRVWKTSSADPSAEFMSPIVSK